MKKRWYRRFLIMVLLFGLFVGGGFSIRNAKQMYSKEEVSAKAVLFGSRQQFVAFSL